MDTFGDYLRQIGRIPLLTDQEEIYCSHQIQAWLQYEGGAEAAPAEVQRRGQRAKTRLMSGNLRLVVYICKKNLGRGLDLQDMVQEGSLGLSRAAEKFDSERGYKFSTYAYWWIRQGLNRALSQQVRTIRMPANRMELLLKIKSTSNLLTQERGGHPPSAQQIADKLDITVEEVTNTIEDDLRTQCCSLDAELKDDGGRVIDLIAAPFDDKYEATDLSLSIQEALSLLNEKDAKMIRMRYFGGLTLSQIAKEMGSSLESVRRNEARITRKLRYRLSFMPELMSR